MHSINNMQVSPSNLLPPDFFRAYNSNNSNSFTLGVQIEVKAYPIWSDFLTSQDATPAFDTQQIQTVLSEQQKK